MKYDDTDKPNDVNLGHIIGPKIRSIREKMNMYQSDFADLLGLKQSNLSGYERGKLPPLDALIKIADLAGISLDELCGRSTGPRNLADILESLTYLFEERQADISVDSIQQSTFDPKDCGLDPDIYPVVASGDSKLPGFLYLLIRGNNSPLGMILLLFFSEISSIMEYGNIDSEVYQDWKREFLDYARQIKLEKKPVKPPLTSVDKVKEFTIKQRKEKATDDK